VGKAEIQDLREGYEAASRGDLAGAFRSVTEDFEMHPADRAPDPRTLHGTDSVIPFFQDLFEPFEQVDMEPQEFFERGDQIVVFLRLRFHPTGSSAVVENQIAHLWTFRDGKGVRCQIFPEREKALEAAGLPAAADPS
jgi:ketosteroid isomerase-like protein